MSRFFVTLFAVLVVSLSAANVFSQENQTGPPPYGDFKATTFPDDAAAKHDRTLPVRLTKLRLQLRKDKS